MTSEFNVIKTKTQSIRSIKFQEAVFSLTIKQRLQ